MFSVALNLILQFCVSTELTKTPQSRCDVRVKILRIFFAFFHVFPLTDLRPVLFPSLQKTPFVRKAIHLSDVISGCLVAIVSIMLPACYAV